MCEPNAEQPATPEVKKEEVPAEEVPPVAAVPEKSPPKKPRTSARRPGRLSSAAGSSKNRRDGKLFVNFSAGNKREKRPSEETDASSSNSSEAHGLYGDVDWEGNLENDSQLDEFAPRRRQQEKSPPVNSFPPKSGRPSSNRFEAGEKVRVHNYNTSTWDEGEVEEMDDLEQEVLIVCNGRKEWLNINSQRISRAAAGDILAGPSAASSADPPTEPSSLSLKSIIEQRSDASKPSLESRSKRAASSRLKSSRRDSKADVKPLNEKLLFKSSKKLEQLKRKRATGLKRKEGEAPPSKFKENEEVLAKWSNYRMQKFPAVIRKVLGQGEYDVLFYDGFVKTITEDHIFKATEADSAKYQGANPSKADSFVEMDEDAKAARRHRKKKTFDDFLSPTDLDRNKRKSAEGSPAGSGVTKRPSGSGKRPSLNQRKKIKTESPGEAEAEGENELPVKMEVETEETPLPTVEAKPPEVDSATLTTPSAAAAAPPAATVTSPKPEIGDVIEPPAPLKTEELPAAPPVMESGGTSLEAVPPPAAVLAPTKSRLVRPPGPPLPDYGDRFLCEPAEGAVPVVVRTKDGHGHTSIILGDKNLLPDWYKHAIYVRGKYQVFLISPEGYKINGKLELTDFHSRMFNTIPSPVLDFVFDRNVIPALKEKQKSIKTPPVRFPTWRTRRKVGRTVRDPARRPARPLGPMPEGKVKTLLPRPRYVHVEPQEPDADNLWKCLKEGCEKTFRKESLLQMHIKHYHAEFKELVGAAPNVVDLALARSESNYVESQKPQMLHARKAVSKMSPHIGLNDKYDSEYSSSPAHGSMSPMVGGPNDDHFTPHRPFPPRARVHLPVEERRSTIKTLLPNRPSNSAFDANRPFHDSDDFESDDEFIRRQRARLKKIKYEPSDSYTEEEKGSPTEITEDGVVIERLRSEEIINCTCGFREEDGLMIQCDICMCWQHGHCSGIESDMDVPERYVCYICRHPYRVRSSSKFNYAVHYLTQGKLPSLSFRTRDEQSIRERENLLKKCFDLTSNLHQMGNVGQSLAVKLKIAERRDHPKLYLWADNWGNPSKQDAYEDVKTVVAPQPEAPIDFEDCRERLVKDVETDLQRLDERLNLISNQISCLEAQASGSGQSDANVSSRTIKQTVQMLMKDLKDLGRLAAISQQ